MTWFVFDTKLMALFFVITINSLSLADDIKIKNESNLEIWVCCAVQWTSYDGLSYNSNSEVRGGWTIRKGETKVISNVPKGGLVWISVNTNQPITYSIPKQFTISKYTTFEHTANYASGRRTEYWTTLPDDAKALTSKSLGATNRKNINGDDMSVGSEMMQINSASTIVDFIRKGGQLIFYDTPLKGGGTFIVSF
ncbi:MAG: hypothetical protein QM703_14220 [Gemmatales bacterium]